MAIVNRLSSRQQRAQLAQPQILKRKQILFSGPECLIVCALEHIGATFKVKWLFEKFLCAFEK